MNGSDELLSGRRIAFFSMEVALVSEIHTYSGGLGVLAGVHHLDLIATNSEGSMFAFASADLAGHAASPNPGRK